MAGLLESTLTWPILPLRGVVSLARVLLREAERQRHALGLRRLDELDQALRSGEISAADHEREQQAVLADMMGVPDPAGQGGQR
jgi:hypothetical protein